MELSDATHEVIFQKISTYDEQINALQQLKESVEARLVAITTELDAAVEIKQELLAVINESAAVRRERLAAANLAALEGEQVVGLDG